MPGRTDLENAIANAATDFAMKIVDAVKGASLQELIELQANPPARRGAKPGPKPQATAKRRPGRPKKSSAEQSAPAQAPKKRVVKNYPKCAYPGCNKNRFPRGKGFCGEHWKAFEAGKIKSAASYKKKAKPKAKPKAKAKKK